VLEEEAARGCVVGYKIEAGVAVLMVDAGVGSNALRLFTMQRSGSTQIHLPSARENTSVQKTGHPEDSGGAKKKTKQSVQAKDRLRRGTNVVPFFV
jgi:hypothetical protein